MKTGFLPLYVELYDRLCPEDAAAARRFAKLTAGKFRENGIDIVEAPVCRKDEEFQQAVKNFEAAGCQAILSLHLAYSPSLEAINALKSTRLPLVILDTTPDPCFTDPEKQLMANHGIHGVQDLGNLLVREGKPFLIAAGEFNDTLIQRSIKQLKSAAMAHKMQNLRIGRIGGEFAGMGDFRFAPEALEMTEIPYRDPGNAEEKEIEAEMLADRENFCIKDLPEDIHRQTVKVSLKVRKFIEQEKLDGFTMCFTGISPDSGWETVPFLECSKAMARKTGYAGEGDSLTAGLHAALFQGFDKCGFAEMFCPDWQNDLIFTSHMGEINPALTGEKALLTRMPYVFGDTDDPAVAFGCFRPGNALWVDIAPLAENRFRLITAEIEFLPQPENLRGSARNAGYFRMKNGSVADFLEKYTRLGGTHHAVAVYDGEISLLRDFAALMKWEFAGI